MKRSILFLVFSFHFGFSQKVDTLKVSDLSDLVVQATRATEKSAMAFTNVSKTAISKQNLGQDLPFLLNTLPSVVVSSDAGAGVGYTGIRIRGTDPTRINVTLNGIPYNDSESQGVYWVNMPDMASSVQSIQVQRGVGSSTNGAGAFGGSINVNTMSFNTQPFAEVQTSAGSFGTLRNTISLSSGLIKDRFVFDARVSKINSDGYVDRATSDLKSFYVSSGYYHNSSFLRFNVFSGNERTYQSWNGIPEALAKNDLAGINDFIDRNGYDQDFKTSLLKSGRRYNFYNYKNEVDNYTQTHYQFIGSFALGENWRFNPAIHYTKGKGYFEQYKFAADLNAYGVEYYSKGSDTIKNTDLIRRKWLDNDFYGAVWSLENADKNIYKLVIGGGFNQYIGGHFGEVIWAEKPEKLPSGYKYYQNNSTKNDFNTYLKATFDIHPKITAYADIQFRSISFNVLGIADPRQSVNYAKSYAFFNPKAGLTYSLNTHQNIYLSYAKGSKEPSRQDFVDNAPTVPSPETLHDFEAGYKLRNARFSAEINAYAMFYNNQLVLTGQINQVGEAIRVNTPNSSRKGIELQAVYQPNSKISVGLNATLSRNTVSKFTATVISYDDTPSINTNYSNTDISFSPSLIAGGQVTFLPFNALEISFLPKYVGKQYLDNTSSETRKLDPYFTQDLRIIYSPAIKRLKTVSLSLLVNNMFNSSYESNGYTYSYFVGQRIDENFVFSQAGINFLAGIKVKI